MHLRVRRAEHEGMFRKGIIYEIEAIGFPLLYGTKSRGE